MDDIEAQASRMKLWLDAFKGAYIAGMPYTAFGTAGIIGLVVIITLFWWLFWQPVSKNEQKAIDSATNTTILESNSNVATDQVNRSKQNAKEVDKNAKESEKHVKTAADNLNRSVRTDSNQYGTNANERFCRKFPLDSSCQPANQ